MDLTRRSLATLAAGTCLAAVGPAGYPARTVRIVVSYPPGRTTDFVARLVATRLTERVGRTFIIENKPGASGATGAQAVARAAPGQAYPDRIRQPAVIHGANPRRRRARDRDDGKRSRVQRSGPADHCRNRAGLRSFGLVRRVGAQGHAGHGGAVLSAEIADILREPDMRRLVESGAVPIGNSPAAFAAVVMAEVEKWKPRCRGGLGADRLIPLAPWGDRYQNRFRRVASAANACVSATPPIPRAYRSAQGAAGINRSSFRQAGGDLA